MNKLIDQTGLEQAMNRVKEVTSTATQDAVDGMLNDIFGAPSGDTYDPLSIVMGGTGANNAVDALKNLGGAPLNHTHDNTILGDSILPIANGGTGNADGYIRTNVKAGTTVGQYSSAEGQDCEASGMWSHAEGYQTKVTTNTAHVEGSRCIVTGHSSHAEGSQTTCSGDEAHSEGGSTIASGRYSHAEGYESKASGEKSHAEGFGSNAEAESSHAEGYKSTASNTSAHAEGYETVASGLYSHAEGYQSKAQGYAAHAEGDRCIAGACSHAEGQQTVATGTHSHATGLETKALGRYSYAGGKYSESQDEYGFAHGLSVKAIGVRSTVFGDSCEAKGNDSFATGFMVTTKSRNQACFGFYNRATAGDPNIMNLNEILIVGNGVPGRSTANCFRVGATSVWGGTYQSSGADYAEMFEWEDGNSDNEDRVGRFVTMDVDKVRYATESDPILGVVSANPSICGDVYDDQWKGMFMSDVFGRPIYEYKTITSMDPSVASVEYPTSQKVNPEYNDSMQYKSRSSRPEWVAVGLIGKLVMVQDGTLTPGCYVKPAAEGIATKSDAKTNCKVMKVIDETHAQVFIIPSL